ncbi:hypothetical protein ACWDRB_47990 [Nonomuraea sp. NPDC003707]
MSIPADKTAMIMVNGQSGERSRDWPRHKPQDGLKDPIVQPTDIKLVPLDADAATLTDYLLASPLWISTRAVVRGCRVHRLLEAVINPASRAENGDPFVRIPETDHEMYDADEDAHMCAKAAHQINAVALGLPAHTPREAVRRLIEIVNLSNDRDPDTWYARRALLDIHTVATGQETAR